MNMDFYTVDHVVVDLILGPSIPVFFSWLNSFFFR
jgi:hypothetical protein